MFRKKCYAAEIHHVKLQSSSSQTIGEDEPHVYMYTAVCHSNLRAVVRFIFALTLPLRANPGYRDVVWDTGTVQCGCVQHTQTRWYSGVSPKGILQLGVKFVNRGCETQKGRKTFL